MVEKVVDQVTSRHQVEMETGRAVGGKKSKKAQWQKSVTMSQRSPTLYAGLKASKTHGDYKEQCRVISQMTAVAHSSKC